MNWWKNNKASAAPLLQQPPEPDPADVLAKMRAFQKEAAKKTAIRIVTSVIALFILIEIAGNFDEFTRDYFAVTTRTFEPDTFTGWHLHAHISTADVTVLVTALLVFNATFAVAFIATFLVSVENKEFEYFRIDWAQTVQVLAVNSASLALTLTITRFFEAPALFVVLTLVTLSVILASQLVNSTFLAKKNAFMAALDWMKKRDDAKAAIEVFLSMFNEITRRRMERIEPSSKKQALEQATRCRIVIVGSCALLVLLESVVVLAVWPVFGVEAPRSVQGWIYSVGYLFFVLLVLAIFPLSFVTFGQSYLWMRVALVRAFSTTLRVIGIIAVVATTLMFFFPYIGTPELLSGGFMLFCNALVVALVTYVVHRGTRTGRGPGKYVALHTLAVLDANALAAQEAYEEAEKQSREDAEIKWVAVKSASAN